MNLLSDLFGQKFFTNTYSRLLCLMSKKKFQNFLSRFLCSKKLENMNLAHFGPGSRQDPLLTIFLVWKLFLINILSKMKSQ